MTPNIFPALRYRDCDAAITFLRDAFGFTEKAAYRGDDGAVHHAEMQFEGGGMIMFGTGDPGSGSATIYAVVADPDAHHARAVAAGAKVTRELSDMDYGSREYGVEDSEGHSWSFGTYDPYAA
ncbi:MAG: hypothetical protein QOF76_277 [Solirubrobacteraceae bacterium]|jgi:uncharacterized glyoxalase superfamily protein PhnB|nr:hypothetical protein [Solirubrobacteraceae bacterium]